MTFSKFSIIVILCYLTYFGFNILADLFRSRRKRLSIASTRSTDEYLMEPPKDLTKKQMTANNGRSKPSENNNRMQRGPGQPIEESDNVLYDIGLEILGDDGMTATADNLLTVSKPRI